MKKVKMKQIFIILLSLTPFVGSAQDSKPFFDEADALFSSYCNDGRVDYSAINSDPAALNGLIDQLAKNEIPAGEEKAYLINAYNLFVIQKVVKNYPITSPMDVDGFFMKKDALLNGEKISLNHLENEVLRKKYSDPRLHFVVVCGAVGCPPIVNFAYRPEKLEEQLEQQTNLALNNASFVYQNDEEKAVYVSKIFEWYAEDFGKNGNDIIKYLNKHRIVKFNEEYKVKFYPYDWNLNKPHLDVLPPTLGVISDPLPSGLNLQLFTAGSLLGMGKMDFTLFNTLYTQNKDNWQGVDYSGYRSTFVTHLFQWTIGVSKNKRLNVGLDLNFRSSGYSSDSTFSGVSNAFLYTNTDSSRVGLTSVGLRLKVQPFKAVADFSIQSTISLPTIKHPEGFSDSDPATQNLYWADWDRITWWNQLFYSKNFSKFQLFTEFDLLFRFKRNKSQIGMLDLPASVFLSYFPTRKITIYAMTQHVHRFTNDIAPQDPTVTDWVIPANYTASGLGFKYQVLPNLNLELLYTNFWRGQNSGLGNTFNLGIKFLTR
jgi:hypothetical protein